MKKLESKLYISDTICEYLLHTDLVTPMSLIYNTLPLTYTSQTYPV